MPHGFPAQRDERQGENQSHGEAQIKETRHQPRREHLEQGADAEGREVGDP